jgi:UDP-glucose 4-epimerase
MTKLSGKSALVTGGAGFIGSHLVEGLLDSGIARVLAVDDLSLGRLSNLEAVIDRPELGFVQVDCSDLAALESALQGESFDFCFNLAVIPLPHSLEHPGENVERNVAMTTAVCELQRRGRFDRLVQYSSSEAYGTAQRVPMDESHPLRPHTPYAAAKAATDFVALSYAGTFDLRTVVVRPFNTYGERQNDGSYAGLIPCVVRNVSQGVPIQVHGDGEQTRDLTHVADTVHGTLSAAISDAALGGTFNLGFGAEASVNEIVETILDALGKPEHPIEHVAPRPGDVRRLLANTTAAREAFGYQPRVTLGEGIARTVEWYVKRARQAEIPSTAADLS